MWCDSATVWQCGDWICKSMSMTVQCNIVCHSVTEWKIYVTVWHFHNVIVLQSGSLTCNRMRWEYNSALSSFYRFIDDFTGVIFLSIYPPFIVFHMWNTVLYCIVLYCIVLYCTVLFKYVIFHIWNTVLVSDQSQLFVAKCKQKCTHVLCSTVQYMYSSVQCSDRARGGWICDSREWWKVWGCEETAEGSWG